MPDILSVEDLTTEIRTGSGVVRAVEGVTLRVAPGEAVGLVGESGCGKSMTALSIMQLLPPGGVISRGAVRFKSTDLSKLGEDEIRRYRGSEIGMIFQDPMTFLNPLMRIGDQVREGIEMATGKPRAEAQKLAHDALQRVRMPRIDEVYHAYPHQLSGGMRQRALIAIAVACRPSLLIADEPTTALDVTIQGQIMELLAGIRAELGSAMIMITHDLGLVAQYCQRVYVMYAGRIVEEGDIYSIFDAPKHPYTRLLLRSCLRSDRRSDEFHAIPGHPPSLRTLPSGCRFHPRCDEATDICSRSEPALAPYGNGLVRCLRRTEHVEP